MGRVIFLSVQYAQSKLGYHAESDLFFKQNLEGKWILYVYVDIYLAYFNQSKDDNSGAPH